MVFFSVKSQKTCIQNFLNSWILYNFDILCYFHFKLMKICWLHFCSNLLIGHGEECMSFTELSWFEYYNYMKTLTVALYFCWQLRPRGRTRGPPWGGVYIWPQASRGLWTNQCWRGSSGIQTLPRVSGNYGQLIWMYWKTLNRLYTA